MKTTVPENNTSGGLLCLLAFSLLILISNPSLASRKIITTERSSYSIVINNAVSSTKHAVRLYTGALKASIVFSSNSKQGTKYQLYVFNMESKLVRTAHIRKREKVVLSDMPKGDYFFQVFSNDEQLQNGLLSVK